MKKVNLRKICIVVMLFAVCLSACGKGSAKKEEKQVVKYMEWEYPIADNVGQTEYNESGDVVLTTYTSNGKTTTVRYSWEDTENTRMAYLDGILRMEVELDKNGDKISSKNYDENGGLTKEIYYEYDNLGNLKTSSSYSYTYNHRISEEPVILNEEHLEYGKNGKDGNIVKEHIITYNDRLADDGISYTLYATEYYYEYNEYGEIISEQYIYDGTIEENIVYEYQRSKDDKSSVGRAYVYDSENEELIEKYDAYEYEYDEDGNMISQCRYQSDGDLFTRIYQEYNEAGSLSAKYFYRYEELWEVRKYTYFE